MKSVRTLALACAVSFSLTSAFAGAPGVERNLFETLIAHGAFLHSTQTEPPQLPGAGNFLFNTLSCSRSLFTSTQEYSCTFTDQARPFEETKFQGDDAKSVYENLAVAGITPQETPFSHGKMFSVDVEILKCSKSGFSDETLKYECFRLKRLME